jgi:hypothetical protein
VNRSDIAVAEGVTSPKSPGLSLANRSFGECHW